jgi:biopolymer transport protein ExbB
MNAFKSFVVDEWYFAFPMFFMSLVAVTLVVWRFLLNMSSRTDLDAFLPEFQEILQKKGAAAALAYTREQPGLIPTKLFVAGLETAKQGPAAMRRAMASAIELEILPQLNFLLAPILAIAKIATMVGLFGTVVSMINTFNKIKTVTETGNAADVGSQAGAIGLALFATALGLITAIPLVFTHVLFKDWIAAFEIKMKSSAQKLLLMMQNVKPGTETAVAKPATAGPVVAEKV